MRRPAPISVLFDYEWRLLRRDAGFWALMLLFAACLVFAVWNGTRWVNDVRAGLEEVREEERERYASLEERFADMAIAERYPRYVEDVRNPDAFGREQGVRAAVMPVAPLAGLAVGQSDLYPGFYIVSLEELETVLAAAEIENPHQLAVGRFDAAFVLLYLWPLLILALTYNLVSAERERGTLALLLSQPMDLWAWVRARMLFRFGLLFLPVVVLGLVAPFIFPGEAGAGEAWVRSFYWTGLALAYGLFWAALAAVVAWRGRSSAGNALTLAFLWLLLVVVAPAATNLALQIFFPMPSRMEYVGAMRDAMDEARREGEELLGQFMEDHPEMIEGVTDEELAYFASQRLLVENRVRKALAPIEAHYEEQAARQREWVQRLRFLSPAILLQDGFGDAAGVGMNRHRHFREQVREFHGDWQEFLHPLILRQEVIDDLDDVPDFGYRSEPRGEWVMRGITYGAGMVIPAFLLVAWIGNSGGRSGASEPGEP